MQHLRLIETKDGSHTLYNSVLNEHYHSTNGAVMEAEHVFIKHGLAHKNTSPLTILEIGFGTGLNALLSYQYALENNISVHYQSIDFYPLATEIIQHLNYGKILGAEYQLLFAQIHDAGWDIAAPLHEKFLLHKIADDIHTLNLDNTFDVVYFDAFAPDKQPDMWEQNVFEKIYKHMNRGGILVTYCAKGSVKRALKATGFEIEKLPGPPGKREMTRALKIR